MKELIVALDLNGAIGYNNQLLCSLPNDLKHFKELTLGKKVIMGRKTWDSLPAKPLPNRENIVFSHNPIKTSKCGLYQAVDLYKAFKGLDWFDFIVIGGSQIYKAALDHMDILYVTEIQHKFENADAWFPIIDKSKWREVSRKVNLPDDKHKYEYHFVKYIKND